MRGIWIVLTAGVAASAQAQDHANCPLMAKEKARQAQVDHRHHQATGLSNDGTVHHFRLAADGGSIELAATDPGRADLRDEARAHLRHVARAFAEGDFSLPERIHEQAPPGVSAMKARRDAIRYTFEETAGGGRVVIATSDDEARAAIHEFLRFQVRDHGTDDPVR